MKSSNSSRALRLKAEGNLDNQDSFLVSRIVQEAPIV